MTEIQTARLLLRPWQPDDLAEFTRLLTDPEVTRYIVVHTPFSPQDVAELSARTLEQWERNGFGPWACAPAKAPGHDPGPCCWPPGTARQAVRYCCPLWGQQSAILRRTRGQHG